MIYKSLIFKNFIAFFLIPLYTLIFVGRTDIWTLNFSVIATYVDKRLSFLIWGALVGLYLYFTFKTILVKLEFGKKMKILKYIILGLLVFTITTPYLPELMPFRAQLHIVFAALFAVLLLVLTFIVIYRMLSIKKNWAIIFFVLLALISFFALYLLIAVGIVSSGLELFLTITMIYLIQIIYLVLCKKTSNQRFTSA